jgi:Domain of unknown function (DUF6817)
MPGLPECILRCRVPNLEAGRKTTNDHTMDEQLEHHLQFLRRLNTGDMPHTERSLLDHLLGTRQLLVEWGARPGLCDAGLFHSIYSTEHYEQQALPLTRRDEVRELIGEEAESLVWLFCMMRRDTFFQGLGQDRSPSIEHRETGELIPLNGAQHQDLLTLLFANSFEGFSRCSWFERRGLRRAIRCYRKFATPSVQRALDRFDVRWWEIWK